MNKQIFITDFDLKRFQWLISNSGKFDDNYKTGLQKLNAMLNNAVVVQPQKIPSNIITMNSRVKLKNNNTGEFFTYTLVFPFDADISTNKISIIDDLGLSLIGSPIGTIITIDNNEKSVYSVEEIIYQPEANGNYYI